MQLPWFKFYGKDFLTDTKLIGLDPLLKLVWVTLLCLADSDTGTITHLTEDALLRLAGIEDNSQYNEVDDLSRTKGCLKTFEELGMITNDNGTIVIINFEKRQNTNLSSYERVKKWRQRHKNEAKHDNEMITHDNVINDNDRIDKNRIDKTRIEKKDKRKENSLAYLQDIPQEDLEALHKEYEADYTPIKNKAESLYNYCKGHGKTYKDYKAMLRNALMRDFGKRKTPIKPKVDWVERDGKYVPIASLPPKP